ncbi:adenine-specific DNA-methyltransferase [Hypnocyclicus thermotrophus]|uniref:site-specific DNA-methyltransferase (adenine-specific) n=1 Tax=Hypnocyclicus thermotrophus TaxID=1627895 RepID=A0AA46I5X8_9FUSO|nr:TaqI-like C-terminal specificity domain-containing protein [Hypnocyclicus thermotrophus]TDT71445.1 adenine-specific DNA-methyltransferase [Hypnocyclicus thermotrophus]
MYLNTNSNYKVYTPQKISRDMSAISLRYFFSNYKKFGFQDRKKALKNLKIVDLSCGSGNLLIDLIEFLIKLHKRYFGYYDYISTWIEGYDIDKEALSVLRCRIKKILDKYKLVNKKIKLYQTDSLLKNFDKKYHIVIGNPPYLGEKNNKEIFDKIKKTEFGKKYYEGRMDYLYFFIEKGIEILEKNGILTYITTNYWLQADYAKKLRTCIKENCSFYYINNINKSVFKDAIGQHNIIFSITKNNIEKNIKIISNNQEFKLNNKYLFNYRNKIVIAKEKELLKLNTIFNKKTYFLDDILYINQGIISGYDKAFIFKEFNEKFKKYLRPFYKSPDINIYNIDERNKYWILYLDNKIKINNELEEYLRPFYDKLIERREVKTKKINWYELQWARDEEIFKKEKIVSRQRCKLNMFAYTKKDFYGSADIYYLTKKESSINLFYILGYLNSSTFYKWFYYNGKRKGKNLELYATPLKETPIYYPNDDEKVKYIEKLVRKQIKSYSDEIQEKIDKFFEGEI